MNYKPTVEDILWAKDVNDRLVATQTYNPNEIREAYKRLFGEDATNQHFARSKVFAYFQYTYVEMPKEYTVGTIENLPLQSHSEDELQPDEYNEAIDANDDLADYKPKGRGRKKKD